jgi:hypothetical protein
MPQLEVNPDVCCEACVFGRGRHSDWCPRRGDLELIDEEGVHHFFESFSDPGLDDLLIQGAVFTRKTRDELARQIREAEAQLGLTPAAPESHDQARMHDDGCPHDPPLGLEVRP